MKDIFLSRRFFLALECAFIFLAIPGFFFFYGTRWNVHLALWAIALYAIFTLRRDKEFSWRKMWHGVGWPRAQKKSALLRFSIATPLIVLLTLYLTPDRLFAFPMHRPWFWLMVMALYPLLSVVPQEVVFRSWYFRRYRELFPGILPMIFASMACFSFVHVVFHNWVSPLLCLIAGFIFAHSYSQHRSLKWVAIEHAAYGCMVFTVGIGFYFLVGGFRPS